MPQYRVLCLSRSTGKQTVRVVTASDEEGAAQAVMDAGYLVGTIELVSEEPVGAPIGSGEVAGGNGHEPALGLGWSKTRVEWDGAPGPGISDFFHFRVLLVPWLVRAGFLLVTIVTAVLLAASLVDFVIALKDGMSPQLAATAVGMQVGGSLLAWVLARVFAESLIVMFGIYERVTEIGKCAQKR